MFKWPSKNKDSNYHTESWLLSSGTLQRNGPVKSINASEQFVNTWNISEFKQSVKDAYIG